jgi:cysteine-rich repeat protein
MKALAWTSLVAISAISIAGCFNPEEGGDETDATSGGTMNTGGSDVDPTAGSNPSMSGPSMTSNVDATGEPGEVCGDGLIGTVEACDDGNTDPGDGCDGDCLVEPGSACEGEPSVCVQLCGNGTIEDAEACDDGNTTPDDGCTDCDVDDGATCTGEPSMCSVCGNGVLEGPEACDDGNAMADDGCSADCAVELYSRCDGEGPGSCAPIQIMMALASNDDVTFRSNVAAITGGSVDYVNAGGSTPTGPMLVPYDCVFTHPDQPYSDPFTFGTVLQGFVDEGSSVVFGIAAMSTTFGLAGTAIADPAYSPIAPTGEVVFAPVDYDGRGDTVIHDGVAAYHVEIYDPAVTVQGMAMGAGAYTNGVISAAYRPDFRVVYLNGTGTQVLGPTGDWPRLLANACGAAFIQ